MSCKSKGREFANARNERIKIKSKRKRNVAMVCENVAKLLLVGDNINHFLFGKTSFHNGSTSIPLERAVKQGREFFFKLNLKSILNSLRLWKGSLYSEK